MLHENVTNVTFSSYLALTSESSTLDYIDVLVISYHTKCVNFGFVALCMNFQWENREHNKKHVHNAENKINVIFSLSFTTTKSVLFLIS